MAAIMMSASCISPQVTRRYAAADFSQGEIASDEVALSLFSMDIPTATAQTTVLSLSESAQASLIEQLSAKVKDAPSLLKVLASPITTPKSPQRLVDRTVVERRVVLSIDNRSLQPASRLHKAVIILSLDPNAAFKSWSQFATKYQTVNLGSVKFAQENAFALGFKVAPPQTSASAEVTGSATATRSLEENLNIQQRFVEATGVLTANEARLIQEGAFGLDLTGNVVIDMTISVGSTADHQSTDLFTFAGLFDAAGKPNPVDAIALERQTVSFVHPRTCQPIKSTAMLQTILRLVQEGDQTLIEGDDQALYQPVKTTTQDFELVPAEALRFSVWFLVDPSNHSLHLAKATGNPRSEVIRFGSLDEANDFLLYLRELPGDSPLSIKGRALLLDDKPVLKKELGRLQAEIQKLNWEKSRCSP
jgi:hypothetical protein